MTTGLIDNSNTTKIETQNLKLGIETQRGLIDNSNTTKIETFTSRAFFLYCHICLIDNSNTTKIETMDYTALVPGRILSNR